MRVKTTVPVKMKTSSAFIIIRVGIVNIKAFHDRFLKQRPIGSELRSRGLENRHCSFNLTLDTAHNAVDLEHPEQVIRVVGRPIDVAVKPILVLGGNGRGITEVENGHLRVVFLIVGEEVGFDSCVGEFVCACRVPEV